MPTLLWILIIPWEEELLKGVHCWEMSQRMGGWWIKLCQKDHRYGFLLPFILFMLMIRDMDSLILYFIYVDDHRYGFFLSFIFLFMFMLNKILSTIEEVVLYFILFMLMIIDMDSSYALVYLCWCLIEYCEV